MAALAPSYWIFALLMVPIGMFGLTVNVTTNTAIQMGTDPAMRGRVMALYMMVFLGGTPLGAPIAGWATDAYGARIGFVAERCRLRGRRGRRGPDPRQGRWDAAVGGMEPGAPTGAGPVPEAGRRTEVGTGLSGGAPPGAAVTPTQVPRSTAGRLRLRLRRRGGRAAAAAAS